MFIKAGCIVDSKFFTESPGNFKGSFNVKKSCRTILKGLASRMISDFKTVCFIVSNGKTRAFNKRSLLHCVSSNLNFSGEAFVLATHSCINDKTVFRVSLNYADSALLSSIHRVNIFENTTEAEKHSGIKEKAMTLSTFLVNLCEETAQLKVVQFTYDFIVDSQFHAHLLYVHSVLLAKQEILETYNPTSETELVDIEKDLRKTSRFTRFNCEFKGRPTIIKLPTESDTDTEDPECHEPAQHSLGKEYFLEMIHRAYKRIQKSQPRTNELLPSIHNKHLRVPEIFENVTNELLSTRYKAYPKGLHKETLPKTQRVHSLPSTIKKHNYTSKTTLKRSPMLPHSLRTDTSSQQLFRSFLQEESKRLQQREDLRNQ